MSLIAGKTASETFFISLSAKRPELGIHFTISEKMFLVILSIFFVNLKYMAFLGHFITGKIFVISCDQQACRLEGSP